MLKKLLIGFAIFMALVGIVGLFLPKDWEAESSVEINGPTDKVVATVYDHISNLEKWQDWSAWSNKRYPEMKSTYTAATADSGAKWEWTDPSQPNGSLTLLEADPAKGIKFRLEFEGMDSLEGSIQMEKKENSVLVRMHDEGKLSGFAGGYMAILLPMMLEGYLAEGLENLKKIAEES